MQSIVYDFKYGEKLSYDLLPANSLSLTRSAPGLYGWFVRLPTRHANRAGAERYRNVLSAKLLSAEVRSHFQEQYRGQLARATTQEAPGEEACRLLPTLSVAFAPPIYVGISSDIRRRLLQHFDALQAALRKPTTQLQAEAPLRSEVTSDTEEESNTFGARIAYGLRAAGLSSPSSLFVKVCYTGSASRDEYRAAETFCNRVYTPLFGRR